MSFDSNRVFCYTKPNKLLLRLLWCRMQRENRGGGGTINKVDGIYVVW